MSASLHTEIDRVINPLDVLEQIIAGNEWVFERRSDEEMAAEAPGKWCDYGLHFSWSSEMSAMAFTCAFDLKVPAARRDGKSFMNCWRWPMTGCGSGISALKPKKACRYSAIPCCCAARQAPPLKAWKTWWILR